MRAERGNLTVCLSDEQIRRQDFVDNSIFEILGRLAPESIGIKWDIELIGEIRDILEDVIVDRLNLMTDMEFYPYFFTDSCKGEPSD